LWSILQKMKTLLYFLNPTSKAERRNAEEHCKITSLRWRWRITNVCSYILYDLVINRLSYSTPHTCIPQTTSFTSWDRTRLLLACFGISPGPVVSHPLTLFWCRYGLMTWWHQLYGNSQENFAHVAKKTMIQSCDSTMRTDCAVCLHQPPSASLYSTHFSSSTTLEKWCWSDCWICRDTTISRWRWVAKFSMGDVVSNVTLQSILFLHNATSWYRSTDLGVHTWHANWFSAKEVVALDWFSGHLTLAPMTVIGLNLWITVAYALQSPIFSGLLAYWILL